MMLGICKKKEKLEHQETASQNIVERDLFHSFWRCGLNPFLKKFTNFPSVNITHGNWKFKTLKHLDSYA